MKLNLILLELTFIIYVNGKYKKPRQFNQTKYVPKITSEPTPSLKTVLLQYYSALERDGAIKCVYHTLSLANPTQKFDNPNFIRDRFNNIIYKPEMPSAWQYKYRKPFNPAWMDYCDPYHCNDYHKTACGLNRDTMKFKWFQSGCHIILNNMCANYRGSRKYDLVDNKYCRIYVMYLRIGCPVSCEEGEIHPVCAVSGVDNNVGVFANRCALDSLNCKKGSYQEYEEVDMKVCEHYISTIY